MIWDVAVPTSMPTLVSVIVSSFQSGCSSSVAGQLLVVIVIVGEIVHYRSGMFQTFKSFNTFKLFNEPISLGRLERFERLELLEPAARSILCG